MNVYAIILSVLIPGLLYAGTHALLAFSFNYNHMFWAHLAAYGGGALLVGGFGYRAWTTVFLRQRGLERDPSWYVFLFVACLFSWLLALLLGEWNFVANMRPFYDMTSLNLYVDVNPANAHGQQLMDAGRVVFSEGSHLDLSKSTGFKDSSVYCVAPVTVGDAPLGSYDFWAVGMDCCAGHTPNFHCGDFASKDVRGGLRLLQDNQRGFYRMAVQQAEALYGIQAPHPLFFVWMQDPLAEIRAYEHDGVRQWLVSSSVCFGLLLVLVAATTVVFSKVISSHPC